MREARYFYVPGAATAGELPADEAAHALRVLRLRSGDEIFLIDGEGSFHRAVVTLSAAKRCTYKISETLPQAKPWHAHIHIAVAPTKMIDRTEWLAEKATEMGIDELTMLDCTFSERKTIRTDRIERIVTAAVKQSRKAWMPIVNGMTDFRLFVGEPRPGRKFIAHCYEEIPRADLATELGIGRRHIESTQSAAPEEAGEPHAATESPGDITVMIGPEGDFSADEVRMAISCGYTPVSLGASRLRTETAALYAAMLAQTANRVVNDKY